MPGKEISAGELKKRLQDKNLPNLLDVREAIEFHSFNFGGIHIPLGELSNRLDELEELKGQEIIVICQRGLRSRTAQVMLEAAGFAQVYNLKGGILGVMRI